MRRAKLELELYLQKAPDSEEAETARASLEDVNKELGGRENGPRQQYSEWLHQYRSGRYLASATALSASDLDAVLGANQLYREMPLRESQVKSAALLHTEAAIVLGQAGSTHLNMAFDYLAQLRDLSPSLRFQLTDDLIGYIDSERFRLSKMLERTAGLPSSRVETG